MKYKLKCWNNIWLSSKNALLLRKENYSIFVIFYMMIVYGTKEMHW